MLARPRPLVPLSPRDHGVKTIKSFQKQSIIVGKHLPVCLYINYLTSPVGNFWTALTQVTLWGFLVHENTWTRVCRSGPNVQFPNKAVWLCRQLRMKRSQPLTHRARTICKQSFSINSNMINDGRSRITCSRVFISLRKQSSDLGPRVF